MFTYFEKEELNFKTPAGRNKISNICNPAWNTVIHVTGNVSGLGEADETRSVGPGYQSAWIRVRLTPQDIFENSVFTAVANFTILL